MDIFTDETSWFAVILGIIVCWAPAGPAQAASATADGCDSLSAVVAYGVNDAMNGTHDDAGLRATHAASPGFAEPLLTCGTVAAVGSRAFSAVLRDAGLAVTWPGTPRQKPAAPGSYCFGHFLDQCYPLLGDVGMAWRPVDHDFVTGAWRGVQAALRHVMPFGTQSDIAWFRAGQLVESLAVSLDASIGDLRGLRQPADRRGAY